MRTWIEMIIYNKLPSSPTKRRETDCLFIEAGRIGHADIGSVPKARDSRADVLRWKNKYGGMLPSDMKRLKQLEEENAKLKKLVADMSLS